MSEIIIEQGTKIFIKDKDTTLELRVGCNQLTITNKSLFSKIETSKAFSDEVTVKWERTIQDKEVKP